MILFQTKKQIIEEFLNEKNKANLDDLVELAGVDSTGKKWYQMKKDINLPMQRYRELEKYVGIMASYLSPDNVKMLCEEGLKQTLEAVKGEQDAWSKVAAIFTEIKDRERIPAPDMIVNIVASQLIREDEETNPKQLDQSIHQSKCDQLLEEADSGTDFFFHLRDMRKFSDLLNPSEATWTEYVQSYQRQMSANAEIIKMFSSSPSQEKSLEKTKS